MIACRVNSTSVLMEDGQSPAAEQEDQAPRLHRWRFNLKTGAVSEEGLDDVPSEFPRINESLTGRSHRYSYAARVPADTTMPLFDGFQKYDHQTGRVESHPHGPGRYGGEGVFVPRTGPVPKTTVGW